MPRFSPLSVGIAILLAGACSGPAASTPEASPSPTPTAAPLVIGSGNAPWPLDLTFTGDLTGSVSATAPNDPAIRNECTGRNSTRGQASWASTMAFAIGPQRYALVILATGYRGPSTFTKALSVEVHSADLNRVWSNRADDPVSFTVSVNEESGSIDATLTNATAPSQKLKVRGRWTCLT